MAIVAPEPSTRLRIWRSTISMEISYKDKHFQVNPPRLTFLPLLLPKVREFFCLDAESRIDMFVDTHTAAGPVLLPMHLPIGLLHDLTRDMRDFTSMRIATFRVCIDTSAPEPFTVADRAVMQQSTPGSTTTTTTPKALQTLVWNSMKQSEFIRRYSVRSFQNLTPAEGSSVVEGAFNLDFRTYSHGARNLFGMIGLKFMPVRLYFTTTECILDAVPLRIDGEDTTVMMLLHKLVPNVARLGDSMVSVILHGVQLDWTTKLHELLRHCTYCDGWLCLSVRPLTSQDGGSKTRQQT